MTPGSGADPRRELDLESRTRELVEATLTAVAASEAALEAQLHRKAKAVRLFLVSDAGVSEI